MTGVSLLALFQWAFRFLHLQLGMHTVIMAHVAFSIAYVVIVVAARLRNSIARSKKPPWIWARASGARSGASRFRALAPAIAAAGMLALMVSFDDYVITSLVAGVDSETLPMVIYAMARRGVSPVVNAVSALIVVAFGHHPDFAEAAGSMNRRWFLLGAGSALASRARRRPRLNVYNWSSYIDPANIERFERESRRPHPLRHL